MHCIGCQQLLLVLFGIPRYTVFFQRKNFSIVYLCLACLLMSLFWFAFCSSSCPGCNLLTFSFPFLSIMSSFLVSQATLHYLLYWSRWVGVTAMVVVYLRCWLVYFREDRQVTVLLQRIHNLLQHSSAVRDVGVTQKVYSLII